MRFLLLATVLLAPCLYADGRECFGELSRYRWFQVESVADAEALPPGVTAVDARESDLDTVKVLAGIPTIEAVRAPDMPEALSEFKRLPKLRLLTLAMHAECVPAVEALAGLEVLIACGFQPEPSPESLAKLAALTKLHTAVFGGSTSVDEWNLRPEHLKALATLPALRRLDLGFSIFEEGALAEVGRLIELEELDLYACWPENDAWEAALKPLKKLRRLRIGLPGGGKAASLPRALTTLQALEVLDIDEWTVVLDETFATAIASLSRLVELRASHAQPDAGGLKRIGSATTLKRLVLGAQPAALNDFSALRNLANLESLELYWGFACDAAIRAVTRLPRLERLTLFDGAADGSALNDFRPDGPLRCLHLADMDAFKAASFGHLPKLNSLRELEVGDCTELEGNLACLADLKQVDNLTLNFKNAPTAEEWQALPKMAALTHLRVSSSGAPYIAGVGGWLAGCSKLESLDLPGWGEFPAAELAQLKELTGLKRLRVVLDEATPEAIKALASLESLEELAVGAIEEDGADWMPLCSLPSLKELTVMTWGSNPRPALRQALTGRDVRVTHGREDDD
jgi:hypothetical protein